MFKKGLVYIWGDRARLFMALGLLAAVLRLVLSFLPEVTEQVYARGFFLGVRWVLDYTIGWSPVPFSYLLILGLLVHWARKIMRGRSSVRPQGWARLLVALRNLGGFAGALLFFFCILWGFNYERVPIEQHLGLAIDSMDVETLCLEAEWAGIQAEADRAAIVGATDDSLSEALLPADLEDAVRACVAQAMQQMDYPFAGRVRGRVLVPGGWMLRVGIAGIYNPFTGEGNVSGAQTPQKIPFTMAHEMAHGCGFGDEGSCNFIGMVACSLSDDPFIRYSGQMAYWLYLYNDIVVADPLLAKMLAHSLAPGIKADQRANYYNYQRYHGKVAELGNQVNNAYLHSQGVQGGIKSYDRVTTMRAAWHRKTGR
jgi:Protein of unknown function (DUF3810)